MNEQEMSMFEAYKRYWKNAFNFTGRARRKEYWGPVLFNQIIVFLCIVIMMAIAIPTLATSTENNISPYFFIAPIMYLLMILFGLATFFPTLSSSIRRLHDVGKSGWWMLLFMLAPMIIGFVFSTVMNIMVMMSGETETLPTGVILMMGLFFLALIGIAIYQLIVFIKDSQPGVNKWGNSPKYPDPNYVAPYQNYYGQPNQGYQNQPMDNGYMQENNQQHNGYDDRK